MNKKQKKYQDKVIKCQHCGQNFAWTAGEQKFYAEKGFQPPKHCRICRAALKAAEKDKFRGRIKIKSERPGLSD